MPLDSLLFVGSLSPSFSNDDLRNVFRRFGQVERAFVMRRILTGESKGYAFVEFASRAQAMIAKDNLGHDRSHGHRSFFVDYCDCRVPALLHSPIILLENLPPKVEEETLREMLLRYGKLKDIFFVPPYVGRHRGSVLVEFENSSDAEEAKYGLHETHIGDNKIYVHFGNPSKCGQLPNYFPPKTHNNNGRNYNYRHNSNRGRPYEQSSFMRAMGMRDQQFRGRGSYVPRGAPMQMVYQNQGYPHNPNSNPNQRPYSNPRDPFAAASPVPNHYQQRAPMRQGGPPQGHQKFTKSPRGGGPPGTGPVGQSQGVSRTEHKGPGQGQGPVAGPVGGVTSPGTGGHPSKLGGGPNSRGPPMKGSLVPNQGPPSRGSQYQHQHQHQRGSVNNGYPPRGGPGPMMSNESHIQMQQQQMMGGSRHQMSGPPPDMVYGKPPSGPPPHQQMSNGYAPHQQFGGPPPNNYHYFSQQPPPPPPQMPPHQPPYSGQSQGWYDGPPDDRFGYGQYPPDYSAQMPPELPPDYGQYPSQLDQGWDPSWNSYYYQPQQQMQHQYPQGGPGPISSQGQDYYNQQMMPPGPMGAPPNMGMQTQPPPNKRSHTNAGFNDYNSYGGPPPPTHYDSGKRSRHM
eukprot:TRINITY_DN5515_c0_g1_i1.p1 TRINITY_DN5515_c0_g1~~TRINITY_DN5515_c0_g1_i1.p1  ORF type:complete len:622 (-),score=106.68 TRINITY_DN5515_c0_g1_i1:1810-3675(-)